MHIKWVVIGLVSAQELTEKQILKQQKKLKKKAEKQKEQNVSSTNGPSRPKIEEIGSAFGDPHFHIESPTEPDLCFDIDGEDGEIFKLLSGSKFDLNGNLFKPDDSEKTYFASFFGISENDAFTVDKFGFRFKNFDPKSEIVWSNDDGLMHYGDVKFNVTKSALNSHKMHIKFNSDIHFTFQDNPIQGNINMKIEKLNTAGGPWDGILGSFYNPGAYSILTSEDDIYNVTAKSVEYDENQKGILVFENHAFDVILRKSHLRNKNCWTVKKSEQIRLREFFKQMGAIVQLL